MKRGVAVVVAATGGLLASGLLASCRSSDYQRIVLRNRGELCVVEGSGDAGVGGPTVIPRDAPMKLVVRSGCLSACVKDRKATCSVKRDMDKLVVTSELTWMAPWDLDGCRGKCSTLEATCNAEAVAGTKVTLEHGDSRWTLDTPTRLASGCLGATMQVLAPVVPDAGPPEASAPEPPASVLAAAAPPSTGAPPTPPVHDSLCAMPFPGKGNKAPLGIGIGRPNPCDGASCAVPPKAPKCTLKRQGNKITVKTDLPLASSKPRKPCTEDCPTLSASCRTEPLPNGSYTIEYAGQVLPVTLPLAKETCAP